MAPKVPLPFPELVERLDECLGCGYPLDGIPAPGVCPECGIAFDDGPAVLVLGGVARRSGGPMWRKVVWVLIGILAFVYSQLWGLLIFSMPWLGLVVFLTLVASVLAMAMTNRQKKRGSEIFAFTRGGFARWTVGSGPSTRDFNAWEGTNPAVFVRRVSSVWASLKIVSFNDEGKRIIPIECGFRCRVEDINWVQNILTQLINGKKVPDQNAPPPNTDPLPGIPLS